MDLRDYIRVLRRHLVVVIAATLIGLSAGTLAALLTPQRYEASTQLMVAVDTGDSATSWEMNQANSYAQQVVESYRRVVTSSLVLQPVVDDVGLDFTTQQLASKVDVGVATRGVILTVTVTDANPGQAARIANAIGDSFSTVITDRVEQRDGAAYSIRIVPLQTATVPTTPAAPNVPMYIALGTLLGLGAGIGIALLRGTLDRRIRRIEDVDKAIGPVLGGIALDPKAAARPLIMANAPRDPRAEAYRSLRTNVRFLFPIDETGVFVVTSAGPAEGKSTTAANLAIALGEAGYRVALVDADLRKPRVAGLLGIEGAIGLTDVLIGRVAVNDVIQRWGRGTFFALPAGTVPPNPAELLGSDAMRTLIDDLKAAFDVVIIDAPPVLPVTDAAVLSRLTTGVILVVAADVTSGDHLAAAADRITAADGRVLGAVVTMLPIRGADKTAYGTYGYGALAKS
ncbi:polysaccharide biosynthesis tyrosine autokinase [Microbacterium esteraromaticum]|uniref:non-specific protein-tyrosine kinase n=1 Tax=Microbacterium esteraromaticum TaxID=57043 RepID=A0A939DUP6_9MICO|nr:polysaccharide biosynthesis tyrosine autokinase [Microbacterium esteraromaticum]MBN8205347.1 polysaccharide biosynthesis tyrosine autokinase [Microbacterium esteraromaticum]MBN8415501.1 polysaccharide biosynthesis tyrosine autokinase [Microbacterium esteraromaticum]